MSAHLQERTMLFAVRIIKLVKSLPRGVVEESIAKQLVRSATSIGANYCEATHARSTADFTAKLKICEGEAAETLYWLQLLVNSDIVPESKMKSVVQECNELVSIFTVATKTARASSAPPRDSRG